MMKILLFTTLLFFLATCRQENKTELYLQFDNCNKLSTQVKVLNNNKQIGVVKNVQRDGGRIIAEIDLDDNIEIPKDSRVSLKEDILGTQRIDVSFNFSDSANLCQVGDTIVGQVVMEKLFNETLNADSVLKANKIDSLLHLH